MVQMQRVSLEGGIQAPSVCESARLRPLSVHNGSHLVYIPTSKKEERQQGQRSAWLLKVEPNQKFFYHQRKGEHIVKEISHLKRPRLRNTFKMMLCACRHLFIQQIGIKCHHMSDTDLIIANPTLDV